MNIPDSLMVNLIAVITDHLVSTLGIIFLGVIVKIILSRIICMIISKVEDDDGENTSAIEARTYTLGKLADNIISLGLTGTIFLMILAEWGVNIAPLLAGAGILGLTIGFGTQSLVKDLVTGFFILFENQFNIGDTIKISGIKGKVTAIKLRTTVLKSKKGIIHIIPNSKITDITKYKHK